MAPMTTPSPGRMVLPSCAPRSAPASAGVNELRSRAAVRGCSTKRELRAASLPENDRTLRQTLRSDPLPLPSRSRE